VQTRRMRCGSAVAPCMQGVNESFTPRRVATCPGRFLSIGMVSYILNTPCMCIWRHGSQSCDVDFWAGPRVTALLTAQRHTRGHPSSIQQTFHQRRPSRLSRQTEPSRRRKGAHDVRAGRSTRCRKRGGEEREASLLRRKDERIFGAKAVDSRHYHCDCGHRSAPEASSSRENDPEATIKLSVGATRPIAGR
jgi:hypothetical protein